MNDLEKRLRELEKTLDAEQKMLFSLKSVHNFLLYYKQLVHYKPQVQELLITYFNVMQRENYCIDKDKSTELAFKYIYNIGRYYAADLGFKTETDLGFAIFWGVLTDFLLLLAGLLSKIHYIPIMTLILICYWGYVREFYEKKNKIFGIRY